MFRFYKRFSRLLLYPEPQQRGDLDRLCESLEHGLPCAAEWMHIFSETLKALTDDAWEELYTRTFDIGAQCPLYLGIHVFGPENHKRPALMTGLCEVYSRHGVHSAVELPDHLAVVLANRGAFKDDEWNDLTTHCMIPAIETMVKELERADNIYRYVLTALLQVLTADQGVETNV